MMTKRLGSVIRDCRKRKKMTCKQVAQEIGIDRSYIGKIETQNLIPAYHIIVKLEAVLGINLKDFYLKEKSITPDFLIKSPAGNIYVVDMKLPSIDKQKNFATFLNQLIIYKQAIAPQKAAYSLIYKFAPEKAKDRVLINNLAGSIERFRKVYSGLFPSYSTLTK